MSVDRFHAAQNLNDWEKMLVGVYGPTQNYSKSKYEILSHLTEVSSLMAKFLVRKKDLNRARSFLPKMFAWSIALLEAVNRENSDLETIILRKFPGVCPYCVSKRCICWNSEKPTPNSDRLRDLFFENARSQKRTINDFQLMFSEIFGHTWPSTEIIYLRLVEEIAELSEAVRIYHLFPKNFENELADYFAWWFALANKLQQELSTSNKISTEQLLWQAYPGRCLDCNSLPCFCSPAPMREVMSKPAPGQSDKMDGLTSLRNQGAYNSDREEIRTLKLSIAAPFVCVRVDVDKFKTVNDTYGHDAGDEALKHIASHLRKRARLQDKIYRVSGDEYALILPEFSEEEGSGLMRRILKALNSSLVRWVAATGEVHEFPVTISVGVAECLDPIRIDESFGLADKAAYVSKESGRNRVSRASQIPAASQSTSSIKSRDDSAI